MSARRLAAVDLTGDERRELEKWVRSRRTSQAQALRARIVLRCAEGGSLTAVAAELGVSRDTVAKWRDRFLCDRLAGLHDRPRPGRPRAITPEQVEQVIVKTLAEAPPTGDAPWSTRTMAAATGMSQSAVSRIWRANGLRPHQVETWRLSADPRFLEKVRDIAGLYLDPPDHALVLCVDERLRTGPAGRGEGGGGDANGGLATALGLAVHSEAALAARADRHAGFLRFLGAVEAAVPAWLDLHVVCGAPALHGLPAVRRWLLRHPRFHLHVTPGGAFWLNLAVRLAGELDRRGPAPGGRGAEPQTGLLRWAGDCPVSRRPFVWSATAEQILAAITPGCG